MCDRHELPPLIEHDVPGIVNNRLKPKLPVPNAMDPIPLDEISADIFKGLLWAILGTMAAIIVASSIAWGFYNVFLLIKASLPIVHMPIWSPR